MSNVYVTGAELLSMVESDPAYDFLRNDKRLATGIPLLGIGGSHAYGVATKDSDIDIRGIAYNSPEEILLGKDFEHVTEENTDTVIYSLKHAFYLYSRCNPSSLELLGLKPEQYLICDDVGQMILDNKNMFLSQHAIYTFMGYANEMLRRLENKVDKKASLPEHLRHIVKTLRCAKYTFPNKYKHYTDDIIELYSDDERIYANINVQGYPLKEFNNIWSELKNIEGAYEKEAKRNRQAIEHDKIEKHMYSLVKVYLMGFDVLEKGELITARDDERDLLLSLRAGDFLTSDRKPTKEFYKLHDELDKRFDKAVKNTKLPEKPDEVAIENLLCKINKKVIEKGY